MLIAPLMYFWNLLGRHKRSFVFMLLTSICRGLLRLINTVYAVAIIAIIYQYRMRLTTIFWFLLIVQSLLALLQIYIYTGQMWVLQQESALFRYLIRKHWNIILRRIFNSASYEWLLEHSNETSLVQHITSVHNDLNRIMQIIPRCIIQIIYSLIISIVTLRISFILSIIYLLIQFCIGGYIYYENQSKIQQILLLQKLNVKFNKSANNVFGTMFDAVINNNKDSSNEKSITRYLDYHCKSLYRELSKKQMADRRTGIELIAVFYIFHCLIIVIFLFTYLDNFENFIAVFLWIRSIFASLEYLLTDLSTTTVDMQLFNIGFSNLQYVYDATSKKRTTFRQFTPSPQYELQMDIFRYVYRDNTNFMLTLEEPLTLVHNDVVLVDGKTGSGKTTFLKILRSIHEVPGLKLRYRDDNIKYGGSWRLLNDGWANLMSNICFCQQSGTVFVDNCMFNIVSSTFPGEQYDRVLVERALRLADVPEQLWDRKRITASTVAGGERQRISIARVLYRILRESNRSIIVLDEIDANLDEATSLKIFSEIFKLCKDKLVFIVAHTACIKNLEEITKVIHFENGNISVLLGE